MSLTTITQASRDSALNDRTIAGVWREAIANEELGATAFGQQVIAGSAPILMRFAYPVAVDNDAAFESAVVAGNPNPGGDPSVITDANIGAAIQAHWPEDAPA